MPLLLEVLRVLEDPSQLKQGGSKKSGTAAGKKRKEKKQQQPSFLGRRFGRELAADSSDGRAMINHFKTQALVLLARAAKDTDYDDAAHKAIEKAQAARDEGRDDLTADGQSGHLVFDMELLQTKAQLAIKQVGRWLTGRPP